MRLLLVADVDPLRVIGGAERLLAGHAAALRARGHEVTVCSGAPGETVADRPFAVERIGRSPSTPRRAAAAVRRLDPDAVLGYQPACAFGALRAARRLGVPAVYVFCSSWPAEYATRRIRPRPAGVAARFALERACLRASDRVVVLSEYSAAQVATAHATLAGVLRVVPGGVDPSLFSPNGGRVTARRRLGLPDAGPLLVTVRNLVPRMGLDRLLEAMRTVRTFYPAVRLVVVGEGPLRQGLEERRRHMGLTSHVAFTGFVPEKRLPDYYRAADLVLLPTRTLESFGLTTVEALACGTPVLGTPVGAIPEVLSPLDQACVTRDATAAALGTGILAFLGSPPPAIARRARRHALAGYTWEVVGERLEKVIREVAAR